MPNSALAASFTEKDIIFPIASSSLTSLSHDISHATLISRPISTRLQSINEDAAFVAKIAKRLQLPVIANERCGSWYVQPELKAGSAYFKSTDGHIGQWRFSLRRLNLQVLGVIGNSGGCIIVDSTRQGKHMPDSFTKTIPIWCAVLNRLLFPEQTAYHMLMVNPRLTGKSEASQMSSRLDDFLQAAKSLALDVYGLREAVRKPMCLCWISPDSSDKPLTSLPDDEYNTIHLCMPSKYQPSASSVSHRDYVQGAGDDNESWSCGLTPQIFWRHHLNLLAASESDLPELIRSYLDREASNEPKPALTVLQPYSWLSVGALDTTMTQKGSFLITCDDRSDWESSEKKNVLGLKCGTGKLGARDLRKELPKLLPFIDSLPQDPLVVCTCATGTDLSVGLALALICLRDNDTGDFKRSDSKAVITKPLIKSRLAGIMAAMPNANPSRATLNAVNAFLMKRPD